MTSPAVAPYEPHPPQAEARNRPDSLADALPVFASDAAGEDRLGRAEAATLLAEVAVHRRVETPLAMALWGPAGSGKSLFLGQVVEAAARLCAVAAHETAPSPFLSRILAARVDAAAGRDPAALLVGRVLDALGPDHAALAEDAIAAGSDPREAARVAGERLNGLRRSLDGERQVLDDLVGRRARLAETVLFEGGGSRLDAYARANRGRFEARLRAFGLPAADPLHAYKELVREASEASSAGGRLGLGLRSLWGFKGQGALLALAVLLAVLGWAAGLGADRQPAVANWLAGFGDRFAAFTDWGRAHLDLLQPVSRIAWALAVLVLLAGIVRAARFLAPISKGVTLLEGDLVGRRRDLDGLLAHQTRRVDQLATEVETAGRSAEAAERRIEGPGGEPRPLGGVSDGTALATDLFGSARTPDAAADAVFARLSGAMAEPDAASAAPGRISAPERILVAIDGLDRLPGPAAALFLDVAHRLLARPGFVIVVAMERNHVMTALGEADPALAAARMDRVVQLSYDLGAAGFDPAAFADLLVDPRGATDSRLATDASRSALDRSLQPFETELVRKLAPFTGATPRDVKRFVNSYRVARADARVSRGTPATLASLAWALALDGTGAGRELDAFERDAVKGKVTMDQTSDLGRAFAAAMTAAGQEVSILEARRGLAVARSYSRTG